jgi:hypothetical protein
MFSDRKTPKKSEARHEKKMRQKRREANLIKFGPGLMK